MDQEKIKTIINGIKDLPTLPLVAQRLRDVMDDPLSGADDAARVIEGDQSLAAKVLSLVNSAYYGLPREITKISQAVPLLGFRATSQLALSISVINIFNDNEVGKFDREGLWRHSIGCAICGRMIARKAGYPRPENCFSGGLLHDVGKLVLDQFLHEELISILEETEQGKVSFLEAERNCLGIDHAVIGEWLARKWKLPLPLVVSIRHHHEPVDERKGFSLSQDPVVDIVRLADTICRNQGLGWNGDTLAPEVTPDLWSRLSLAQEDVDHISKVLEEEVRQSEIFLALMGRG
ncbi:MAG: HDOD domain-containing protein [Deltaproteobacteria bacterium]|nr:HDOD domain-containing protein [Deltaproteobacteria bacterium]MBW2120566.1 HDOD domain-containing protein [Deltaproteobacteria bacterium]